ncbi:hypothetical protein FRC01_013831 [Tulasnella sp. 417]|nr:hypothetical protein FRC01_013831 [Tulasnella sp. 417]
MRKLQNKFRAFLSAEESFWSGFALRLVRTFGLTEAKPALLALNITSPDPSDPLADVSRSSVPTIDDDPGSRNDAEPSTALPPGQRDRKLDAVSKVLVHLGDLARYREQYNEVGGRPKAGQLKHSEEWKPRRGRGGKKETSPVIPRERDFTRASECYQQARLLFPDNGNAPNQLAVLAIWTGDSFLAAYHCYRAMAVRQPFPTAQDNLVKSVEKVLAKFKAGEEQPVSTEVDAFKDRVLYLHGIWVTKSASSRAPKQAVKVIELFQRLVQERQLQADTIVKTLVMAFAALWRTRMYVEPVPEDSVPETQASQTTQTTSSKHWEPFVLNHALDLIGTLMEVSTAEMAGFDTAEGGVEAGASQGNEAEDNFALAQRITAVFRRALPALRIASKWLKANLEYVVTNGAKPFWVKYAEFATRLAGTFPTAKLPALSIPLEEDVDMKGFAPLKRTMMETKAFEDANGAKLAVSGDTDGLGGVHPNEEHLMRIGDLLLDTLYLAQSAASPIKYANNIFFTGETSEVAVGSQSIGQPGLGGGVADAASDVDSHRPAVDEEEQPTHQHPIGTSAVVDDDAASASTRTDDDPVNLAMRATLEEEDEDDDEQILYPIQRKPSSEKPLLAAAIYPSFPTPSVHAQRLPPTAEQDFDAIPNVNTSPRSTVIRPLTTASDLLAQAMSGNVLVTSPFRPQPTVVTPTKTHSARPSIAEAVMTPTMSRSSLSNGAPPMLFGASESLWTSEPQSPGGRPQQVNRWSHGPAGSAIHGYSMSQGHPAFAQQGWGGPPDLLQQSQASVLTQATLGDTSQRSGYDAVPGAPLPFNPAPGSNPRLPPARLSQSPPEEQFHLRRDPTRLPAATTILSGDFPRMSDPFGFEKFPNVVQRPVTHAARQTSGTWG